MLIYVISFTLSLLLMDWAIKCKSKWSALIFHSLAVIPPIFLLTFRAEGCGTDTINYTRLFFSLNADSWTIIVSSTRMELLFTLIMFVVHEMNLSIEYLFFLCGALTVIPVYYGANKMKEKLNPLLLMALFYLMFYQYSFNIVRQSIAMSLLFLSVVYLIENKRRMSFVLGVISTLFHTVAIIYVAIYVLSELIRNYSLKKLMLNVLLFIILLYFFQTYYSNKIEYLEEYLDSNQRGRLSENLM